MLKHVDAADFGVEAKAAALLERLGSARPIIKKTVMRTRRKAERFQRLREKRLEARRRSVGGTGERGQRGGGRHNEIPSVGKGGINVAFEKFEKR